VRECPVPLSRIQKSRASIVSRVGLAASGSERAKERERERLIYIYNTHAHTVCDSIEMRVRRSVA